MTSAGRLNPVVAIVALLLGIIELPFRAIFAGFLLIGAEPEAAQTMIIPWLWQRALK